MGMQQSTPRPQKYVENASPMYTVDVSACVGGSVTLPGQTQMCVW
jgi:hypothetical protein